MLKGRQLAHLIYDHYSISEAEGMVLEFKDLVDVQLIGDNVSTFLSSWEDSDEGSTE